MTEKSIGNISHMDVLITGATGFVGAEVLDRLVADGVSPLVAVRHKVPPRLQRCFVVEVGDIDANTDWTGTVARVGTVLHLAARAHVMRDTAADPLAAFREVNVAGTLNLARQAAAAGVRRFVFLSSIKVNGEQTPIGHPFTPNDAQNPADSYGISKYEAEQGLRQIAEQTGMEVVIIRPVLVYGPGVKGNFLSMMCWLQKGIPLPFGAVHNTRSLVALENLVDLIVTCLHHPAAANQIFLVCDGEDLSVTELLKRTAAAMDMRPRLIQMPESIIKVGATLLGRRDVAQRLCGSLQVDISKNRDLLGWTPPVTVDEALKRTADDFLRKQRCE